MDKSGQPSGDEPTKANEKSKLKNSDVIGLKYFSMLINLWTGRKPTKRTFEMLCNYFSGIASEAELLAHLQKRKAKDEAQGAKTQS